MDEFLVHFCCRHPRGWCGLKSPHCSTRENECWSPPARVVWIEIIFYTVSQQRKQVATREGGVD